MQKMRCVDTVRRLILLVKVTRVLTIQQCCIVKWLNIRSGEYTLISPKENRKKILPLAWVGSKARALAVWPEAGFFKKHLHYKPTIALQLCKLPIQHPD